MGMRVPMESTIERPLTALEQAALNEAAEILWKGFGQEIYKVFINANNKDPTVVHSINFVVRYKK